MKTIYCIQCGARTVLRLVDQVERKQCPDCQWIHYEDPKVAAGVILFRQSRVLLVRRTIAPEGTWTFPGGYVDRYEDPDLAAIREVREETGIEVSADRLLKIYRASDSPVLLIVYLGTLKENSPPPTAMSECDEVRYFEYSQIPWDNLAFQTTRQALKDAYSISGMKD